ncbi:MAG TPA: dihydrofolate reductase family protein [Pseudonocardiaceae bacterium]|nr:dihydrofolate reductase family protein [Pseudonocardiaceae bacterium]
MDEKLTGKVLCGVGVSLDGFVAGVGMTEERPFGDVEPGSLHRWMFDEPEQHKTERAYLSELAGAYIMGRNMFGPSGAEYDRNWRGWWGEEPPYHAPVFVLTHRPREPLTMEGGTTFHFVTDGIESALRQARAAAGERPVLIAGGAQVVNQYLAAGFIDELWIHTAPVTIGHGPRLFTDVPRMRFEPVEFGGTSLVSHVRYRVLGTDVD